jgi:DNA primase
MINEETFLNEIVEIGRQNISRNERALSYVQSRGVSPDQVHSFDLGYAPENFDPDIKSSSPDKKRFNDWISSSRRPLSDRILLPVKDPLGHVVGIHTRTPSHSSKDYMKFYLQDSKASARFFGIGEAMKKIWKSRKVVICEGLFDLFPLQRNLKNTICTLTAKINERQLDFLKRFVDEVCVAFDNDEQGEKFYNNFKKYYQHDFSRIWRLKFKGKDVSECWSDLGEDQFQDLIDDQWTEF